MISMVLSCRVLFIRRVSVVVVTCSLFLSSCKTAPVVDTKLPGVQTRAPVDVALGEVREPHEDEDTERILAAVKAQLLKEHPPKSTTTMTRDVHQKSHGCVVGTFTVESDLDPSLQVGVFSNLGKSHPLVVRFSNANPQSDIKPDARGLALKILDVDGEKLIDDEKDAKTHDFLLVNGPVFFVRNLEEYVGLVEAVSKSKVARDAWLVTHPHAMKKLLGAINERIENPLLHTFHSTTPYNFGGVPAKYRVRPCEPAVAPRPPENPSPSYLKEAMKETLRHDDVCFHFDVQRQTNAQTQPVEDPTVQWMANVAPFERVATIRIPTQLFDTPRRRKFCENLSFTPWHALQVHRPLGGVNRARLRIYELISRYRNGHNNVPHVEPTSLDAAQP